MTPEMRHPQEEGVEAVAPNEDDDEQDRERVLTEPQIAGPHRAGQHALDECRSVERRDRDQIEGSENRVGPADGEDDVAREVLRRQPDLPEDEGSGHGENDVDRWSRQADQEALVARVPELPRIDGHGLGVAEGPVARQDEDRRQDDRPEGIDVGNRVEGEPARSFGRVVPESERHPAVGDLMEDHGRNEDREEDDVEAADVHRCPPGRISAWMRSSCSGGRPAWPRAAPVRWVGRSSRTCRSYRLRTWTGRARPRSASPAGTWPAPLLRLALQ